jgi:integrase
MTQPTRRKRRAPGEGSITKRKDGLWAGMLDLGWQDGRRKRKFVYARTRAEAARKLADASRDLREGRLIADERMTVEQYLRSWLEIIEPTIAARTHKRYGQLLRLHAYPYIGRLRLSKLEPSHLAQLYARRIKTGLSPTTVLQLHRVLHHSLKDGHRQGLAPRNVAELVTPPVKAEHEFITLSPSQARRFLEIVEGNRLHALYSGRAHDRHARRRAARAALGGRRPRRRRVPCHQAAQAANLTAPGPARGNRGPGAQAPPRTAGAGTPASGLDLGG